MSPNRRNLVVGATVISALIILGWMLLKFGATPARLFAEDTMPVRLITDRADGISQGSQVYFRGVIVGKVSDVNLIDRRQKVQIDIQVDLANTLPGNLEGIIRYGSLLGGSAQLVLEQTDPSPSGTLTAGTTLSARFVGLDVLPREFSDLATELRLTSRQFRESKLIENVNAAVVSAGKTIDGLRDIVTDETLRKNLQESLANVKSATETATRVAQKMDKFGDNLQQLSTDASATIGKAKGTIELTQAKVEDISRQLSDRMGQIGKLLETFQSISAKIDAGKGTAGQLVNDPRLYDGLVDTSKELKATITDLKRLVEQWEQEGVSLKLR